MSTASSGQQVTDSLNGKLTFEQDKNRIVGRDENNLMRLLILANGTDFVMKVSQEGVDVLVATDAQLIFNSDRNMLKIVSTGSLTTPSATATIGVGNNSASSINSTSVTHGLTYAPIVMGFYQVGASVSVPLPYTTFSGGTNYVQTMYSISSSSTHITLTTSLSIIGGVGASTTVGGGVVVKYLILQETAN